MVDVESKRRYGLQSRKRGASDGVVVGSVNRVWDHAGYKRARDSGLYAVKYDKLGGGKTR